MSRHTSLLYSFVAAKTEVRASEEQSGYETARQLVLHKPVRKLRYNRVLLTCFWHLDSVSQSGWSQPFYGNVSFRWCGLVGQIWNIL